MKILAIELTNTDAADIVHCAVEGEIGRAHV